MWPWGHVWIFSIPAEKETRRKIKNKTLPTCIPKAHLIPLVHSSCASAPRKRQQRGRKDLTIQGAQEVSLKNLVEDPFLWVNRKIVHLYGSQLGSSFHILDGTNTELSGSLFIQWFIYNVLYPVWFKENHRTNEIMINLEGFQPLAVGFQRDGNLSPSKPDVAITLCRFCRVHPYHWLPFH